MKYLKYFEENNREFGNFYWSVHKEPKRFRKELEKIGCPERTIRKYLNETIKLFEESILFVGVISDSYSNKWYISNRGLNFTGYEYQGPVTLSREELDEIDAYEKAEKYNL